MAFVLSFGEDGPNTDVVVGPSRAYVAFGIGFDPYEGAAYTLAASMDTTPGFDGRELTFWIDASYDDGREECFWSGAETRFLGGLDRAIIREALLIAIRGLIRAVQPDRVVMVAMTPNLPEAAIRKYLAINDIFTQEGYEVTELQPQHGTRSWFMGRTDET